MDLYQSRSRSVKWKECLFYCTLMIIIGVFIYLSSYLFDQRTAVERERDTVAAWIDDHPDLSPIERDRLFDWFGQSMNKNPNDVGDVTLTNHLLNDHLKEMRTEPDPVRML